MPGLLDRSRCIAPLTYDRWRVPPAALAIQLSIGQVYAFSVFSLPLSRLLGITESAPGDWSPAAVGWIFSLAVVVLGLSAFMFGRWIEDAGPRKAMFASACCVAGGLLVAALGIQLHEIWIVYVGYGVIGGIGLGLGYLSPVATLLKWFPDRPGLASGLAIMGFGGGAMVGTPLAVTLMERFSTATNPGVAMTLVAMGLLSFVFMMFGAFTVRLPASEWKPATFTAKVMVEPGSGPRAPRLGTLAGRSVAERKEAAPNVHVSMAMKTRQFWLLWIVLCLNVTAGIGALSIAAPMIQAAFPFVVSAFEAAAFVGLLGLANMLGRIVWPSTSDYLGRKRMCAACLALGAALLALVPATGEMGGLILFVVAFAVLISLYGGAFALIPAYLRDMFGVLHLDAIHGRMLSAWSVGAVAGPLLMHSVREYQGSHGASAVGAYAFAMYLMGGLLVLGLVANALITPVDAKFQISPPGGFRA